MTNRCGRAETEWRYDAARCCAGLREIRTLRSARRGGRPPRPKDLLRGTLGRLFRAAGRDVEAPAGSRLLDLLPGRVAALAASQTAHYRPERLDVDRRGNCLSRSELPDALS